MAGVDYFDIRVRGKGAHAGMQHEGVDTVLAACHIVTAFQSVASRNVPPHEAVAIAVPRFRGATAYHVLPDETEIGGSVRYFDAAVRETMEQRLRSEEHTSELQSLMRISYAVFCLKKKKTPTLNRQPPKHR